MRLRTGRTALLLVGVLLLALVVAGFAQAKPRKITGKLSQPGLTVLALDKNGELESSRAGANGKFKLRPPAMKATLHLRAKDGTYAGPIVVGKRKKGKRAIVGVKAGAKLGKLKVRAGKGYAKPKQRPAKSSLDTEQIARAENGVPIGAGNFGRVAVAEARGPGSDLDLDGIPASLDIDDDGDLILDDVDSFTGPAPPARRQGPLPGELLDVLTQLPVELPGTANANAPGTQIEAALPAAGRLLIEVLPSESRPELDCAARPATETTPAIPALAYCSYPGTGRVFVPGAVGAPFPGEPGGEFDPDGDGFGTLLGETPPGGTTAFMALAHGATAGQIGTGDLLIERMVRSGEEVEIGTVLPFVFGTVPALVSYSDTGGNSAPVSYPVSPGAPGTPGNGFPVAAGSGGDVVVTLTFWRPQRQPIEDEVCPALDGPECLPTQWIDVGRLTYQTIAGHLGPVGTPPGGISVNQPCPQSSLSTTDLELGPSQISGPGFTDVTDDQLADPMRRLTLTVNLTDCLESAGASAQPGDELHLSLNALVSKSGAGAGASQGLVFAFE